MTDYLISVAELKNEMKNDQQLFLVDVRSQQERDMLNIGGMLIPFTELSEHVGKLDRNKNIVFYCHTGARSMMAVKLFTDAGYPSVKSLAGGMMAWQAEITILETESHSH